VKNWLLFFVGSGAGNPSAHVHHHQAGRQAGRQGGGCVNISISPFLLSSFFKVPFIT